MVERPTFFPNTPVATKLIISYREAWIPNLYDPHRRECVAFSVQSACSSHEIPLEWVLKLHNIPGSANFEGYWDGLREHLESLPFIEGVQFENISDFNNLLEKISTMDEGYRLLLMLYPKEWRAHLVHVIDVTSRVLGKGSAILVNDNEKGIRKIGKREFGNNIASGALYNCIFFKEAD